MSGVRNLAKSRCETVGGGDVNPFEGVFTIKRLAAFVARELGLPVEVVLSPARKRDFALARAITAHFALKRGMSYPQIGRAMDRDHSTIVHAVRNLPGWLKLYPDAAELVKRLSVLLQESKAHHAHIIAWRAHQALPAPVRELKPIAPPSLASKAEIARFAWARKQLEHDERNRRQGSALLAQSIARAGGWR